MRALSGGEILSVQDLATKLVKVPEFGEDVGVICRAMTVAQRMAWRASIAELGEKPDPGMATAILVVYGTCDLDGKPLFTLEQAAQLKDKSFTAMERLAKEILALSALLPESPEGAAKN